MGGNLAENVVWVGSWCDLRGENSRTYGRAIPVHSRCGRLHACTMHHIGVPDYLFVGMSKTMSLFADWGPKIDDHFQTLLQDHGRTTAWMMLRGGGHTMIRAHLNLVAPAIQVVHLPGLVESID